MIEEQLTITQQQRLITDSFAYAQQQYSDVVALLADRGYNAYLTETGGGCLGIEVLLSSDHMALITSNDGPLPYERDEVGGWAIGVYDTDDPSELISYQAVNDKALQTVIAILDGMR